MIEQCRVRHLFLTVVIRKHGIQNLFLNRTETEIENIGVNARFCDFIPAVGKAERFLPDKVEEIVPDPGKKTTLFFIGYKGMR